MKTVITVNAAVKEISDAYFGGWNSFCFLDLLVRKGGVTVDELPDDYTGMSLREEDDGTLTITFERGKVYSWYEYTGHLYYGSPYETCDRCGNCDGARCDTCHKVEVTDLQVVDKDYLRTVTVE